MKANNIYVKLLVFTMFTQLNGCRDDNDRRHIEQEGEEPQAFLIQGATAKVFQNVSSELRCEALKDYFTQFAIQALDSGKLENFSCEDRTWSDRDDYEVKLQLKAGHRIAVIWLRTWGTLRPSVVYCPLPFENNSMGECYPDPAQFHHDETDNNQPRAGVIHPNMKLFKEFFVQYIAQPQTVDLAFGMETKEFASRWISKLNAGEMLSIGREDKLEFGLSFPQTDDILSGTVEVSDINADDLARYGFMGCTTKECLKGKTFPYIFNGHHVSIRAESGHVLTIPLAIP
ncbi:MAG TPA: hypothetical protein VE954_35860 [Oligoflexus sp.]|uniref:hypothetical protein n=1 Tax=Oligoflexus sp. TaxID=1971216 RepID=UPI002D331FEB|nr:hypothetical protein [Oligoflexus sp.]HYX38509.1 hypothetical protein [Oligoflexus sp.]